MFSRLHMPLDPETRLGAYEIVRAIGTGGRGEVYTSAIQLVANWPASLDQ